MVLHPSCEQTPLAMAHVQMLSQHKQHKRHTKSKSLKCIRRANKRVHPVTVPQPLTTGKGPHVTRPPKEKAPAPHRALQTVSAVVQGCKTEKGLQG